MPTSRQTLATLAVAVPASMLFGFWAAPLTAEAAKGRGSDVFTVTKAHWLGITFAVMENDPRVHESGMSTSVAWDGRSRVYAYVTYREHLRSSAHGQTTDGLRDRFRMLSDGLGIDDVTLVINYKCFDDGSPKSCKSVPLPEREPTNFHDDFTAERPGPAQK